MLWWGEKMPDYKTHSIHSETVMSSIHKRTNVDRNDLVRFAFGPDSLMFTDYGLFDYQHSHDTGIYFETLLRMVKERKLQDNSKVMAFVYGQLDHFVLDLVMHPLIYYMTEKMPSKSILKPHALVELWISDYVMLKQHKKKKIYYYPSKVLNPELRGVINDLYLRIFRKNNMATKYDIGVNSLISFDKLRLSKNRVINNICKGINIGDFFYDKNVSRVTRYLNLNHHSINNPISGEEFIDSFDDLWKKSLRIASELIEDVNNYLYLDRPLNNYFIRNNISYNTGFPCTEKEEFKFVKKY